MRALGIDLSEWDLRPLDWSRAREVLSFAFIKISQGTNPDPLFRGQWEAAGGYVLRGLYHFFEPSDDDKKAVEKTLDLYSEVTPGELPPVLDLEKGDKETALTRARGWLETWETKTGVRPIVYSSPGWLRDHNAVAHSWLKRYPLWLAQYPYDLMSDIERANRIEDIFSDRIVPVYPSPLSPWVTPPDFYQWTSRGDPGRIPGYYMGVGHKKAVDLNYYFGTKQELFTRFGAPKERPETGESMDYKYSITPKSGDGLKIRSDHYVVDSPMPNRIGSLPAGQFAYGNERWNPDGLTDWLKVELVNGEPFEGWIAARHKGTQVGTIQQISEGEIPGEETPSEWAVHFDVKLNPAGASEDITGEIEISSPGRNPQKITIRLPKS